MISTNLTVGELADQFLQCVGNRDAEGAGALFAEHVDWYVGGNPMLAWTGRRTRGAQVAEFLHTIWPHFTAGASIATVEQKMMAGAVAVIFATFVHTSEDTGRRFETPMAIHLRAEDGRLVLMHLYEDTWAVSRAVFA